MYDRKTLRAGWHDYTVPTSYFVTLCTQDRVQSFGMISDGIMRLNMLGCMARQCWYDIPNHFPHVSIDTFVCMPDHIHGILHIGPRIHDNMSVATVGAKYFSPSSHNTSPTTDNISPTTHNTSPTTDNALPTTHNISSTPHNTSPTIDNVPSISHNTNPIPHNTSNNIQSRRCVSGSLGSIIRGLKIGITMYAKQHTIPFTWHMGYHDSMIRDYDAYERIKKYIQYNPKHWKKI